MLLGNFNKDSEKYEELLRTFDILGGYVYQKEYNTALKKFGFLEEDKNKKTAAKLGYSKKNFPETRSLTCTP